MPDAPRRRVCATVVLVAVLGGVTGLPALDRPIRIVETDPAPARIDDGTYFFVGGLVTSMVRNRHTAPVRVTLRAWVFDQAGRMKGTNAYCVPERLERGTRRVISLPLEVRGLAATDSVTVAVERVVSDRVVWTMADPVDVGASLARRGGVGGRARLTEQRADVALDTALDTGCPCDCASIAEACEAHCGVTGLSAFTCTPSTFEGCSASCSCK